MTPASAAMLNALLQAGDVASLPARPPIGGPLWSYVVPAALLAVATLGTLMLYRHFARQPRPPRHDATHAPDA